MTIANGNLSRSRFYIWNFYDFLIGAYNRDIKYCNKSKYPKSIASHECLSSCYVSSAFSTVQFHFNLQTSEKTEESMETNSKKIYLIWSKAFCFVSSYVMISILMKCWAWIISSIHIKKKNINIIFLAFFTISLTRHIWFIYFLLHNFSFFLYINNSLLPWHFLPYAENDYTHSRLSVFLFVCSHWKHDGHYCVVLIRWQNKKKSDEE